MNLRLMLKEAAGRYRQKTAIIAGERRLSFADLDKASNRVAHALIKMGVSQGERVAMLLTNSPEFVIIYFGIVKAGAIAVPLDTKYKTDELGSLFDDCSPRVLVTESPTLELLIPALPKFKSLKQVIDLSSQSQGQFLSYQEIMASNSAQRVEVNLEPEDIAHIGYTSGPTFDPRGVLLSQQCLVTQAIISAEGFQQTEKDIALLFALPMHHVFGLVVVMLASLYKGSTVVIVPGTGLSLGSLMATIERERGTIFYGVPYIFALAIDLAEKEGLQNDLSSLRLCTSGGSPLSIDTIKRFEQHFGLDLIDFWGLTEAGGQVTCPPLDSSRKLGSIGKALPGWKAKIVDDNGLELPSNETGEIVISGPIMKGYHRNPQATKEVLKNGWLYTGDIGRIDEDGYLFITGRKKDTIIVKGQNISPGDIENMLLAHPAVAEALAIGIPDELRGEVIGAVISLKDRAAITEQEIKQFCLERFADYKAPRQVYFLPSLPRTAGGKIDKKGIQGSLSIPPLFPETQLLKKR